MKKLIFSYISLFTLLISYALPSNAQQAFYIYRNDGSINTFITTEIDSMTYSRLDLDSVAHNEYIVHEVYTPDSIYRIPIELIDSVGFVTPETVYQPGVKVIEGEMRNYIISRNELTLVFQSTTPNNFLPHVGDKLVTTEVDDVITNAFVGQVSEINTSSDGIVIVCEPVDLTDVFETYYGIIRKTDEPTSVRRRSLADGFYGTNGTRTFSPGKLTLDLLNTHDSQITYSPDDELSFSLNNARAAISLTPTINYNSYVIVNKSYGVNISVTAIGNYTVEEIIALSGSIQFGGDVPLFEKTIPIPEALIDVYFEFGIFNTMTGKFSVDQTWTQKYRHTFHWEWSNKGHQTLKNVNDFKPVSNTHNGKIALNGSWGAGAYGKVGIAFIATSSLDIAEIGLRVEGGLMAEGTYVPYKRDEEYAKKSTDLYNQIKDREVTSYFYYGLSGEAKLFKWSVSHEIPNFFNLPLNKRRPFATVRDVPLFSDTKLTKNESGTYFASTNVAGNVQPTDVGFALINKNNEEDATYSYSVSDYEGPKAEAKANFFNKPKSSKYTVYPLVKYMGMELLAEPSAVVQTPLQFKELTWANMQYANDNVNETMLAIIEVPSDEDVDLSSFESYGVYVKNNITGEENYYSVQENRSMRFLIPLEISRDEFEKDYDSFTATCNKILFSTYTKDKDGKINLYDEREPEIIYDVPPSITFTRASITGTEVIERDEENRPTRYRTYYSFGMDIIGAFWIYAIQYCDYSTSYYWNGSSNWGTIHTDASYPMKGYFEYDADVNMSYTEYYRMQLTDGSTLNSTNSLVFGGVPSNPTVYIGGEPSQAPAINVGREEVLSKKVFRSPLEIAKENTIIRNCITNKVLEER